MDEMDEDEDEKLEIDGVPFIVSEDFLLKYGKDFSLFFNDEKQVVLKPNTL